MLCENAREHLQAWSDGERLKGWRQEIAVLSHCLRCASCRAYRRQLRRLRQVTRRLPSGLSASLEPGLLALLTGQMPDMYPAEDAHLPQLSLTKEMKMRKRLTAATCATLVIALTGALTAQMLHHKTAALIEDHNRHQWHITSDYLGQVKLYDTQGAMIGVAGNYQRNATPTGSVELEVEGARYQLHPGKQEIRDGKGTPLGFAELLPPEEKQSTRKSPGKPLSLAEAFRQSEADEAKYGGVSGISASIFGAHGWDKALKVNWKIGGQVKVRALDISGHVISSAEGVPLTAKMRRELGADVPPATPLLKITVNGKTHQEQGYGKHDIKNEAGKTLLRLDVQPLAAAPEAPSIPADKAPASAR